MRAIVTRKVSLLFGYVKKLKRPKVFLVFIMVTAGLVGLVIVTSSHFFKKGPETSSSTKLIYRPPTDDQVVDKYLSVTQEKLKQKDYDSAEQICSTASARYYYADDFAKSKTTIDKCFSDIPQDKISWKLYRSRGYINLELKDKHSAEKDFTTSKNKYKDDGTQQSKDIMNELNQGIAEAKK